jgi:hypothetical protein
MPQLTRRRYPERQDCWHVYLGDVHVGTIVRRVGQPHDQDAWQWLCGFYPGSNPASRREESRRPLSKLAPTSMWRGGRSQLGERPPTIRLGAISGTGRPENMPCGSAAGVCRRTGDPMKHSPERPYATLRKSLINVDLLQHTAA